MRATSDDAVLSCPAVSCAETLFNGNKQCPACKTVLDQPDDVVLSSLNPSADYRTVGAPCPKRGTTQAASIAYEIEF